MLHLVLLQALAIHKRLNIIQVGAYDGVINDPLRSFIVSHVKDLNVLMIEPQAEAFRHLQALYDGLPNVRCVNKAIGAPGVLTFYTPNNRYRTWFRQKTGQHLPTSTSSFVKEHVAARMRRMGVTDCDAYIDNQELEVVELLQELPGTTDFHARTDLLQVDCEGLDDQVIYHSGVDVLRPRIINFESKALAPERLRRLKEFLSERGYETTQSTRADTIAINMA